VVGGVCQSGENFAKVDVGIDPPSPAAMRNDRNFMLCFFVFIIHGAFDFFDLIVVTSQPTNINDTKCVKIGRDLCCFSVMAPRRDTPSARRGRDRF
jgi:hypothetical protein